MPPTGIPKDFFISHHLRDNAWAEWIASQLEASGYSTIIQVCDFAAPSDFTLEMDRALEHAHKLVLVLSRSYLECGLKPDWAAAIANHVIPVRIEELTIDGPFAPRAYIDLTGKDENAAKAELLSRLKDIRAEPSQPPGDSLPPAFPGTPDRTRFVITTEWPHGRLYSKSTHPIRVTLPPRLDWIRMKFEYKDELVWVSGPGKVPDRKEFICEFPPTDVAPPALVLKLGIRSPREECVEPITIYFYDRDKRQISESSADLELVPVPEPPPAVRPILQTLRWLVGVERDKPLGVRVLNMSSRLMLLVTAAASYHYFKAPEAWNHFKTDLGILPAHVTLAPRTNPRDPTQEFAMGAADTVRQAWGHPSAWTIEPGLAPNGMDGKLRLIGPGAGRFPLPERSALYDFHMAMAIELQPQGAAAWIVRARTHAHATSLESIPGYHFALTNRGTAVYLKATAVGATARIVATTDYNLLRSEERPLDLSAACCSPQERIRVQIEAKDFQLKLAIHLQRLGPQAREFPPDQVYTEDLRRGFRWGFFEILQTSPGAGPAYEFIRLQDAS